MNNLGPSWSEGISDEILNYVFKLRLKTPQGVIDQDIRPFVDVDYGDPSGVTLIKEMTEVSAVYAFISMILADQKLEVQMCKRKLIHRRAIVMNGLLKQARDEGYSTRRQDIEDLVEADEQVSKMAIKLMLEERTESKLIGVVSAIRLKAESLRSLAGFKKQEMQELSQ